MKETNIEKAIKNYIFHSGGWAMKIQSGMIPMQYKGKSRMIHLADSGTPDMVGVLNGHFIGIEVKSNPEEVQKWIMYPQTATGKESNRKNPDKRIEAQKEASKRIREAGGFFCVVCSVDEFENDLKSFGIIKKS